MWRFSLYGDAIHFMSDVIPRKCTETTQWWMYKYYTRHISWKNSMAHTVSRGGGLWGKGDFFFFWGGGGGGRREIVICFMFAFSINVMSQVKVHWCYFKEHDKRQWPFFCWAFRQGVILFLAFKFLGETCSMVQFRWEKVFVLWSNIEIKVIPYSQVQFPRTCSNIKERT